MCIQDKKNDVYRVRHPLGKGILSAILPKINTLYPTQPYLRDMYKALFLTAYYGLFRIGELTSGDHPVLAKDVFLGTKKNKILFILHTSKTHWKDSKPQQIKIASTSKQKGKNKPSPKRTLPCPFDALRVYFKCRGPYRNKNEPFFVFSDGAPVRPSNFRECLKECLKLAGYKDQLFNTHSFRLGRSCDLFKLGVSVETIKKLGRWKSNVMFTYL